MSQQQPHIQLKQQRQQPERNLLEALRALQGRLESNTGSGQPHVP
jgi:hypothetical protein